MRPPLRQGPGSVLTVFRLCTCKRSWSKWAEESQTLPKAELRSCVVRSMQFCNLDTSLLYYRIKLLYLIGNYNSWQLISPEQCLKIGSCSIRWCSRKESRLQNYSQKVYRLSNIDYVTYSVAEYRGALLQGRSPYRKQETQHVFIEVAIRGAFEIPPWRAFALYIEKKITTSYTNNVYRNEAILASAGHLEEEKSYGYAGKFSKSYRKIETSGCYT